MPVAPVEIFVSGTLEGTGLDQGLYQIESESRSGAVVWILGY